MCQLPWTPSKKLGIFLIYLLHQASGMPPPPTYRFHTPPPLPFIHSRSASHYLYLKCRSRLTHQKHMLAAYVCTCGVYRSSRVHASVGTCDLKHTNSHYFSLKTDMWVHCEIGPRCTPEIPKSRSRDACCFIPHCQVTGVHFLQRHAFLIDLELNQGLVLPLAIVNLLCYL